MSSCTSFVPFFSDFFQWETSGDFLEMRGKASVVKILLNPVHFGENSKPGQHEKLKYILLDSGKVSVEPPRFGVELILLYPTPRD